MRERPAAVSTVALAQRTGSHAVLLIHGLCGTPHEMGPLAARLRACGYTVVRPIFDDSYHMVTLDNERAAVAQAAVDFLERQGATLQAQSGLPGATQLPRSVAILTEGDRPVWTH